MLKRFEEKSVLITGASRGIGKGIAQRFANEGASLILAANEASVHELAEIFKASGVNATSVVCDVTQKTEVEHLYERAVAEFGKWMCRFKTPVSLLSRDLKNCRKTTGTASWQSTRRAFFCVARRPPSG